MIFMDTPTTLYSLRVKSGLSASEIGRRMGMHYSTVTKAEVTGYNSLSTLRRFADAIGKPFAVVLAANDATREHGRPSLPRGPRPSKDPDPVPA